MSIESYLALFLAMVTIGVIPGPAVFAVTSASLVSGAKRGILMTIGLTLSDYVFIILAISGLSVVAELMGEAFVILKYLCALYLLWMGVMLFRSQGGLEEENISRTNHKSAILTGFLISFSNPKAIIFYVALFPAFVDVNAVSFSEVLGIMLCATLAFGPINLAYTFLGARAKKFATTSERLSWLRKIAGSVMAGTGVTIALRS